MGIVKDTVQLKTLEKGFSTQAELLAQLLAEQQQTNQLLAQLIHLLGRQATPSTTTWGRS
jgi:hypothetical protein